ncbi:MAG: hypothetical protein L3J42_07245 [Hydrogenimonas sp.]|nr:hypothetical protein [Hydrogenimonas sp.]
MRGLIGSLAAILFFVTMCAADESVWKKATSKFGSSADRYLYLALPLKESGKSLLSPLVKEDSSYYVKSAEYKVSVRDGKREGSFRVNFGVRKIGMTIRGIKNGIIVDVGEKEIYDIFYKFDDGKGKVEYHNYFKELPAKSSVRLFPGFYGSKLFGRFDLEKVDNFPHYIGCSVKREESEYIRLDPSAYTDMRADPYESGDRSLLLESSLLDYASKNWDLISELRIWNIFHYGISRPKDRTLTGFLKIEFYVKPVAEPYKFGNVTLPFSNIWYEVNYSISSEMAKAALFASEYSLVPQRSFFLFRKSSKSGEKIDFEVDISIDNIVFEKIE